MQLQQEGGQAERQVAQCAVLYPKLAYITPSPWTPEGEKTHLELTHSGGWLLLAGAGASCYCRGALSSAPMSRSATVTDAWLHHLRSVFLRLERSAQP